MHIEWVISGVLRERRVSRSSAQLHRRRKRIVRGESVVRIAVRSGRVDEWVTNSYRVTVRYRYRIRYTAVYTASFLQAGSMTMVGRIKGYRAARPALSRVLPFPPRPVRDPRTPGRDPIHRVYARRARASRHWRTRNGE